jgi:predicted RND superfamily exporter protein
VSAIKRVSGAVTGHSKVVILVMLLVTAGVGWGIQDVEQSSNLAQFESDTDATEKSEYIAQNFSTGDANTTTVQIIVRSHEGANVLSKESLIASLEFQQDLRSTDRVDRTLVDENPTIGVANVVARTVIVRDEMQALERRGAELQERNESLQADAAELQEQREALEETGAELQTRNESLQQAFRELQANRTQLNTESEQLERSFAELRANQSALANRTDRLNGTAQSLATELVTIKELQAEYDSLNVSRKRGDISAAEYEQRAAAIEDRIAQAKTNASTLFAINATEAATFNATAEEIMTLQHRLHELNVSYAQGEISEAEYRDRAESYGTALETKIQAGSKGLLEDEYAAVERRGAELQQRAAELKQRQAALKERGQQLQQRAGELEQRRTQLEADAAEFEQRQKALQEQAAELEQRKEELKSDFEAFQEDRQELLESPPSPTLTEQIETIRSMNESELEDHLETLLSPEGSFPGGEGALDLLPTSYEPGSTSADARMLVVTQEVGDAGAVTGPGAYEGTISDAQLAMEDLAQDRSGERGNEYVPFGMAIITDEIDRSMSDSLAIVAPLALLFVLLTLLIAYRDLLDILLGVLGIALVLVWAFGLMGWADITFNQIMIAVPVLLIGLSIDYAIHIFMRHREERASDMNGEETSRGSMTIALAGVGVALVYVTATTVIGFLSNLTSPVPPIQDFGIVSAAGITAALLIFGLLIPALKVELDTLLEGWGLDRKKRAFGTGGGRFSQAISFGSTVAKRMPMVIILVALLLSAGAGYYGSQVDTAFEQEDFIADDPPEWMTELPEPFKPGEYSTKANLNFVYGNFQTPDQQGEILIEAGSNGDVTSPDVLAKVDEASTTANIKPVVYEGPSGQPDVLSPLSVMHDVAARNETFNETFRAADTDDDGVPDENVTTVYGALFETAPDRAGRVIQRTDEGEYVAIRMQVAVKGSASAGAITNQMRELSAIVDGTANVEATATGDPVVNKVIQDQLFDTVIESLLVTLVAVFLFLMIVYRLRNGSATLGFITLLPVALAVGWILGTMYLMDIPFNAITGTITSLTIGLGVAYTIHLSERYTFELDRHESVGEAMDTSTIGTGGALLGSAATTAGGFGVLAFSILPALQQFGIITAITIIYACFGAVFILPSLLVVWTRYLGPDVPLRSEETRRADKEEGSPGDDSEAGFDSAIEAIETADRDEKPSSREKRHRAGHEELVTSGDAETKDATAEADDSAASRSAGSEEASRAETTQTARHDGEPDDPDAEVTLASGATIPGRGQPEQESSIAVERSVAPVEAEPGEEVTVVLVAHERSDHVVLKETVPGIGGAVESFDPKPKIRSRDDRTIYVVWDPDAERAVRMTYTTTVPKEAAPGEVLEFEGVLEHEDGETVVGGDQTVTVVDDRVSEFMDAGVVTDENLEAASAAVSSGDLSGEAFELLYRRWLDPSEETDEQASPTDDNGRGG